MALSLLAALSSTAYDFKDGNCYYTITSLSDLTVALTNSGENVSSDNWWEESYVACYGGEFRVPETASYAGKTFTVTSIESIAFLNCSFSRLTIPETILSASISGTVVDLVVEDSDIPLSEFRASAKSVYMGRNISEYWSYSFSGSDVESVTFGDKVTYISREEFSECTNLASVTLSDNVQEIYENAFHDCPRLKHISGKGIVRIGTQAFCNCISLETFDFPNLKRIEDGDSQRGTYRWGVFQGCISLKNAI